MAEFVIVVDSASVTNMLSGLAGRLSNLQKPLEECGSHLVASVRRNFELGQSPAGKPWLPSKRALAENGRTLIDNGDRGGLLGSIVSDVTGNTLTVGTNKVYAAAHQFGTKAHKITAKNGRGLFWRGAKHPVKSVWHPGLVARPFMGVSDKDVGALGRIIADYVAGAA